MPNLITYNMTPEQPTNLTLHWEHQAEDKECNIKDGYILTDIIVAGRQVIVSTQLYNLLQEELNPNQIKYENN